MHNKRSFATFSKYWLFIMPLIVLLVVWAVIPAIRAFTLVTNFTDRSAPYNPGPELPVEEVHFMASDGIHLAGWLAITSHQSPTIILVHGFKGSRVDMLPWARFLF